MGGLCSAPPPRKIEEPAVPVLYGNILDNSSRTIMTICTSGQIAIDKVNVEFLDDTEVNRFK